MKNESETSKNCVDQIFTGENKKNQVVFLTIFEVYVFSQWNFASSIGKFFGSAVTYTFKKSEELPLASSSEVFTWLWLSTPTFCIKDVLSVYWSY